MNNELIKMRKTLTDMLASSNTLKQAIREVNKIDIIKGCLVARTPKHRDVRVDKILDGELQKDVSIGDYMFIQNCRELVKAAYNNLEMGNSMNGDLLLSSYRILAEDPKCGYRKSNPVVYEFNHVPPERSDVEIKLTDSFRKVYTGNTDDDIVARAMYIHNSVIDIWPFDDFNGELAVFAMNYYLIEHGFAPIDMPIDKTDYDELVAACLKGMSVDAVYEFLSNAVAEKMARTIAACRRHI